MKIDKIETVRTLLKYTGNSNDQRDAVIRGAITILQSELPDVGTVGTEQKAEPKPKKAEPITSVCGKKMRTCRYAAE